MGDGGGPPRGRRLRRPAPAVDVGDLPVEPISTGRENADDWIAREAAALRANGTPFWLVTSDRELRERASQGSERTIGGGAFARTLLELRG